MMLLFFPVFAQVPQDPLEQPQLAATHDWCAWQAEHPQPADFSARIDDESIPNSHQTATKVVDLGWRTAAAAEDCEKTFSKARKTLDKHLAKATKKIRPRKANAAEPEIRAVQETIAKLAATEQVARRVYIRTSTSQDVGEEAWLRMLAALHVRQQDSASTAALKSLLETWDWIDIHRFGQSTSKNAWLLAQHADREPEFQAEVLGRMEKHLESGGVRKGDYAYLWDRVAVNHDRLQRYGTQPTWECTDGKLTLAPLEDPEAVDARRATMNLGTAQEQLDEMSSSVCR